MAKTDKSIHNICIAGIKRSTHKPYDFKWTRFYESNADFLYPTLINDLAVSEQIICSTIIDDDNYSILTTRRLFTKQKGNLIVGGLEGSIDLKYGDFKGYTDKDHTFGKVKLHNGDELNYFIETGYASMVMIHGVRTLLKTTQMTNEQLVRVTRIWNKRSENNNLL